MIKNLIFDMGGIILPMRNIEEPVKRFGQIGLKREVALQMFGIYGQQGIFFQVEEGSLSAADFLSAYRDLTGYAASFEEIAWAWRGFVYDPPAERLMWMQQLRAEGYHVALLSNTNPFLMSHCDSEEFTPEGHPMGFFFDRIYYSYLLGACKPDVQAFRRMLKLGDYNACECLFLDDAFHNVEAARTIGMHALHVPDNKDWLLPLREMLAQ